MTQAPLHRPTDRTHTGEDLPRPSSGPLVVIGGTLVLVTLALAAAMSVGAAASLTW